MELNFTSSTSKIEKTLLEITFITYYVVGGICLPLSLVVIINLCRKKKVNEHMAHEDLFIVLSIFVLLLFHSIADLIPSGILIEKKEENTNSQFLDDIFKNTTNSITNTTIATISCKLQAFLLSLSIIGFLGNSVAVSYSVYKMIFCGSVLRKQQVKICLLSWIISFGLTLFGLFYGSTDNDYDFDQYCWFQGKMWNKIYNISLCIIYLLGFGIVLFIFIKIDRKRRKDNCKNICLLFLSYLMMIGYFVDSILFVIYDCFYENPWFNFFVNFPESLSCLMLAYIYRNHLPRWMTCSVKVREIKIETIHNDESWRSSFLID